MTFLCYGILAIINHVSEGLLVTWGNVHEYIIETIASFISKYKIDQILCCICIVGLGVPGPHQFSVNSCHVCIC